MRLMIKQLGPLKKNNIRLGDITLLLGPPNTGKSYTLKALYSKLFLLDEYALKIVARTLSDIIQKYLENEFPQKATLDIGKLLESIAKISSIILLNFKNSDSFYQIKNYVKKMAEEAGLQAVIEKRMICFS